MAKQWLRPSSGVLLMEGTNELHLGVFDEHLHPEVPQDDHRSMTPSSDDPWFSRNERWARAAIDAAPVAMVMIDHEGRIVLANQFVENVFGYQNTDLIGQSVEILMPSRFRPGHARHVSEFLQLPEPKLMGVGRELEAVGRDGHEFPVEIGLTPIEDGDDRYVLGTIIDISERKRLERETTVARIVQEAMLPKSSPDFPGLEIAGRCLPAEATGGDFFDYLTLPGGKLAVSIGDASGHGFGAALIVAATRSYLRATARVQTELSQVLASTNSLLLDDVSEGCFVTLFLAVMDAGGDTLAYCGAGHDGYVIGPGGELRTRLHSTGPLLGLFPDSRYERCEVSLHPGDVVVLFTDGIEETPNARDELFGRERILRTVAETHERSADEIVDALFSASSRFGQGLPQHDDVTAVVMKRVAPSGQSRCRPD